jgi:hypothetical protein
VGRLLAQMQALERQVTELTAEIQQRVACHEALISGSAVPPRPEPARGAEAIMAVAHALLTIIFHLIRDGSACTRTGASHYDEQYKPKVMRRLVERLQKLGCYVTLEPIEAPCPAPAVVADAAPPPQRRRRGHPCK